MNFKDITQRLQAFSQQHDLLRNTMESCRVAIQNGRNDNPEEGYPLNEIEIRFSKHSFIFNQVPINIPIVRTKLDLYYLGDSGSIDQELLPIGYYSLDMDEEGNTIDDWLVYD